MNINKQIEIQKEYIKKINQINENNNLKYHILTMGCQLNENDSEKLCGMIEEMGYVETKDQYNADLVLFNTCCVRENAEDKLFGKLGELKKIKQEKNVIIAIGRLHDARRTYNKKDKTKLSICRYYFWNSYSS